MRGGVRADPAHYEFLGFSSGQGDEYPTPAIKEYAGGIQRFNEQRAGVCDHPLHTGHRFAAASEFHEVGHIDQDIGLMGCFRPGLNIARCLPSR